MAVMHFDLLSFTTHVSCKRKHTTPANIHTEVVWSSLNKIEKMHFLSNRKCLKKRLKSTCHSLFFLRLTKRAAY